MSEGSESYHCPHCDHEHAGDIHELPTLSWTKTCCESCEKTFEIQPVCEILVRELVKGSVKK